MRFTFTLRLLENEKKFFGPGVMELLERVGRLGSLRAAAADMEMAYSKAWTIIRNAEEVLGYALLESTVGGRKGGGAKITEEGGAFMDKYRTFDSELHHRAEELFNEIFVRKTKKGR